MIDEHEKRGVSKRREILAFIQRYVGTEGYAPTIREIGDAVGLASTSTVHAHIATLEREGFIANGGRPRTISVLSHGGSKAGAEYVEDLMTRAIICAHNEGVDPDAIFNSAHHKATLKREIDNQAVVDNE